MFFAMYIQQLYNNPVLKTGLKLTGEREDQGNEFPG